MLRAMLDSHPARRGAPRVLLRGAGPEATGGLRGGGAARPGRAGRRSRARRLVHPLEARSRTGSARSVTTRASGPCRRCSRRSTGPTRTRPARPGTPTRRPATSCTWSCSPRSFPDARFVHLVRDGRDVVPSLVGLPYFPDRLQRGRPLLERPGAARAPRRPPPRSRSVLRGPLRGARRRSRSHACGCCATSSTCPTRAAMLDYPQRADEVVAAVVEVGHHQGLWQAPTVGVRDWRVTMSPHDQQVFEVAGRPHVGRLRVRAVGPRARRCPRASTSWPGAAASGWQAGTRRVRARVQGAWGSVSR